MLQALAPGRHAVPYHGISVISRVQPATDPSFLPHKDQFRSWTEIDCKAAGLERRRSTPRRTADALHLVDSTTSWNFPFASSAARTTARYRPLPPATVRYRNVDFASLPGNHQFRYGSGMIPLVPTPVQSHLATSGFVKHGENDIVASTKRFVNIANQNCWGDNFTCYGNNCNCCGNTSYCCWNKWNCHHSNSGLLRQ